MTVREVLVRKPCVQVRHQEGLAGGLSRSRGKGGAGGRRWEKGVGENAGRDLDRSWGLYVLRGKQMWGFSVEMPCRAADGPAHSSPTLNPVTCP